MCLEILNWNNISTLGVERSLILLFRYFYFLDFFNVIVHKISNYVCYFFQIQSFKNDTTWLRFFLLRLWIVMTKIIYPVDCDKYITTFPTRGIALVFIAWTRLVMMRVLKIQFLLPDFTFSKTANRWSCDVHEIKFY